MKKLLCHAKYFILLAVLIAAAMVIPVCASSGSTIDAVLFDFSDETEYLTYASFYDYADYGTENYDSAGSLFEFTEVNGVGCLKLDYCTHKNFAPYRIMPKFINANHGLTTEHRYMRITYMTDDNSASVIKLRNNGAGTYLTVVPNTNLSNGEFVTSGAIDIWEDPVTDANDKTWPGRLDRFIARNHCTFEFFNYNEGVNIYIKEIAFFKSEADAYAYYDDAPVIFDFSDKTEYFKYASFYDYEDYGTAD